MVGVQKPTHNQSRPAIWKGIDPGQELGNQVAALDGFGENARLIRPVRLISLMRQNIGHV
jgi:hypothetical protein